MHRWSAPCIDSCSCQSHHALPHDFVEFAASSLPPSSVRESSPLPPHSHRLVSFCALPARSERGKVLLPYNLRAREDMGHGIMLYQHQTRRRCRKTTMRTATEEALSEESSRDRSLSNGSHSKFTQVGVKMQTPATCVRSGNVKYGDELEDAPPGR